MATDKELADALRYTLTKAVAAGFLESYFTARPTSRSNRRRRLKVVGYVRVSTSEQGDSGAGLDAQRSAIKSEASRRGWNLLEIHEDVASGKSLRKRLGLEAALHAVETGEADGLVVAKLDRLSRSLQDFSDLMARARMGGWAITALDVGVDTTTPAGEMVASMMAVIAQWERRIISQRTSDALAERKKAGVKLGSREPQIPDATRRRIKGMRSRGWSVPRIVEKLKADGVPTARGGEWRVATVQQVLGELKRRVPA